MDREAVAADAPAVIFAWAALLLDTFFLAQLLRPCVTSWQQVLDNVRARLWELVRPTRWCEERSTAEDLLVADGILQQRIRMARGYAKLLSAVSTLTVMNVQWNVFMRNPRWMSNFLVWVIFLVAIMSTFASAIPQVLTARNLDWWYIGGMLAVFAAMSPLGTSPDQAVLVSLALLALYRLPAVTFATRQWLVVLLNVGMVVMYLFRTNSEDFASTVVDLNSVYVTMWIEVMNFTVICVVSFFLQASMKSNMIQTVQYGKATKELNAASSLLQLTCDAVVELDENLCLVAHSPELAAMLLRTRSGYSLEGVCFTDLMASSQEAMRAEEILLSATCNDFNDPEDTPASQTWRDDSSAHAFHTRLIDSCSAKFRTEVFRVRYNGLDGHVRHLLGLRDFTDDAALASSAIDAASSSRVTPMNSTSCASFGKSSDGLSAKNRRSGYSPENQEPLGQIAHLELDVPSETVVAASPAAAGLEGKPFAEVFANQGIQVMRSLWKEILSMDDQGVLAGKQISIGDLQVTLASGTINVSGNVELLRLRGAELRIILCFKVPPPRPMNVRSALAAASMDKGHPTPHSLGRRCLQEIVSV